MMVLDKITNNLRQIAVLIDPEKSDNGNGLIELIKKAEFSGIDFIFVGGSTVSKHQFVSTIDLIKQNTKIPVVIFPGSAQQLSANCDALLYLSLLSGRNPDFLIGHHVNSALEVESLQLEVIPVAYILIEGGTNSSVAFVSQTTPIPKNGFTILRQTALAGKFLGKKLIYLDAGSGAQYSVNPKMVETIANMNLPVIVGGGVRNINQIKLLHDSGANLVVVGNKLEKDSDFLLDISTYKNSVLLRN
jgi:putative glycerol-1-phosphate prenyltransferase